MRTCSNCGEPSGDNDRCRRCSPGRPRAERLSTAPTRSSVNVDEAIKLRDAGWTLERLAERYGVTRQCVSRTLKVYEARRAGDQARFRKVEGE